MAISTIGTDALAASAVTSTKLASGVPSRSQLPAGTVLQVVSQNLTSTLSGSAATWVDVLSATITPTSSTSKILIRVDVNGGTRGNCFGRILRDSTPILVGDSAGSRIQASFGSFYDYLDGNIVSTMGITGIDAPATTSAITYKIQLRNNGTAVYVNRGVNDSDNADTSRSITTITLMEIAA